ncbi:hypothetical protein CBR_g31167 [Chara braunii]|uniref:Uncharacterized protein n=1 Tax=Chara braunii TaxID=69332 RepID=A0A388LEH2_CHABU|nr:hypothetical protein CBR_g31167 [Chara braunii]|eukprot:GBG80710.1 hypothetical protein CBR_g31167 [Chara braunii]
MKAREDGEQRRESWGGAGPLRFLAGRPLAVACSLALLAALVYSRPDLIVTSRFSFASSLRGRVREDQNAASRSWPPIPPPLSAYDDDDALPKKLQREGDIILTWAPQPSGEHRYDGQEVIDSAPSPRGPGSDDDQDLPDATPPSSSSNLRLGVFPTGGADSSVTNATGDDLTRERGVDQGRKKKERDPPVGGHAASKRFSTGHVRNVSHPHRRPVHKRASVAAGSRQPQPNNSSRAECNLLEGRWVRDLRRRPVYSERCKYISPKWKCKSVGRKNFAFIEWRWEPAKCHLPKFDALGFLHLLRNKTMTFVGDSLARTCFASLLCLFNASTVVVPPQWGNLEDPFFTFQVPEYGLTLRFATAHFLVRESSKLEDFQRVHRTQKLPESFLVNVDVIGREVRRAVVMSDILFLGTGQWYDASGKYKLYARKGLILDEMDDLQAFEEAMTTVRDFIRTSRFRGPVYIQTYSPSHFSYGNWKQGGMCNATNPLSEREEAMLEKESVAVQYTETLRRVFGGGELFRLFDIMHFSMYRADAHSIAEYRQRFEAQLALIEAEEQRQAAAEAAAAAEKQQLQAEADADTQVRRKEAQDLLQRHEATSIEKLKLWHFEPSEHHEEATPEEQHKELLAKLVTRLVYTCNHLQSELAILRRAVWNHKDLHEDATRALDSRVTDLHENISWEELTRLWKKRFIVDDASALAINRLFSMTQGNTSTRDWLTEWQKIAATPDLELPFSHLRREFYNRSCAALSLALGDREQYTTFAEIINKAREIIKTNRAAAHEKSAWQPTYVEKGKFGPRPQHVAAVQPNNIVEDPAATQASREGDQLTAVQP